ncbi:helix-turn-helix domain-containing GNAT family N-acetyltransferase [Roseobacter sp. YSTF-M11]|uniref:Helix-turn-helix domain-containing GNAT family N-acetyltransferase n=2 Tax=Roseobacter insulae TaxID=2859783 RepID=A0A9X1FS52_9RHOB|nr:helix-turn-helix domain-containing GNAT family N-acetyltransferase [Roseobacter insulae]
MQKGLAGTALSPSAVHTIIELGYGTVTTASDLGDMLRLEKSSISRLVQKLIEDGLVEAKSNPADRRSRKLALTGDGKALLKTLEDFGRQQMRYASEHLAKDDLTKVETGLTLFAKALRGDESHASRASAVEIRKGYCPGVIASVVGLHASYYATNYGFGAVFERKVATEMSEFMGRLENPANTTFSAFLGDTLLGSVSLDGEDLGEGVCHLRWFIVSPEAQGTGIGNVLLEEVTLFVDAAGFERTRLWTFKGLDAARHLYEKHGFELVRENRGKQWGTEVIEQEFERKRT